MLGAVSRMARWLTILAGAGLLAAAFLVSAEVILRQAFLVSSNAGSELSSYMLGIAATWGLAYTLLMRSHVRVDALTRHFPARLAGWIDLVAILGLGAVALLLLLFGAETLLASWSMNSHSMTPLRVPLWAPQALWVAGLVFFVVTIATLAVAAARALTRGEFARAARLIGVQGAQEEAAEILVETGAAPQGEDEGRAP